MKGSIKIARWVKRRAIQWLCAELAQVEHQRENNYKEYLKTQLKHCGEGVCFNGQVFITGASAIVIGNNVHLGNNAFIRGEGGLEIGDNTHISRSFVLYTINHDYVGKCLPYDENITKKPVHIGKNVWIGMNVCIAPGTTIGNGAIIGMGTVVFGNVPPFAIIGSRPWRQIGERDTIHYARLEQARAYGGVNGAPVELSSQTEVQLPGGI